jgi:ABC-type lipoprotein release transport system permease subunit
LAQHKLTPELNIIVKPYSMKKYVPTALLDEFIKNGYRTYEESELIFERNARQNAEKFTRRIAITTILVTLLVGFATIIINLLTYSNEREMIIRNPGEKNYHIEIQDMEKYLETMDRSIEIQERYLLRLDEILQSIEREKAETIKKETD